MNRTFQMLGMLFAGLLLGLGVAFMLFNYRFSTPRGAAVEPAVSDASLESPENNATAPGNAAAGETSGSPGSAAAGEASETGSSENSPLLTRTDTNHVTADAEIVRIPRKFFKKIHCAVFNTASNVLSDEIVELLQISPDEREKLNRLIAATRDNVEAHELDHAVVTEQTPSRVVLKIAGDAATGQAAADNFTTGVRDILGDNADELLSRTAPYEATIFSNFGRYDTTLTVTRDDSSGLLRMQSQQDFVAPDGSSHGTVNTATLSKQVPDCWKKFFQPAP